jgi:hypothetical protein
MKKTKSKFRFLFSSLDGNPTLGKILSSSATPLPVRSSCAIRGYSSIGQLRMVNRILVADDTLKLGLRITTKQPYHQPFGEALFFLVSFAFIVTLRHSWLFK